MHPYTTAESARIHRQDLLAAAEHQRLVSQVRRTRRTTRVGAAIAVLALMVTMLTPVAASARQPGHGPGGVPRVDVNDGVQVSAGDVFFLDDEAVLRNPDGETPDDVPLFSVAGVPLDLTWGEFSGAEARSLAVGPSREGDTFLVVHLDGLVPDGVYSLFHTTFGPDSENPGCPGVLRENPVRLIGGGTPRPDASSFTADSRGRAFLVGIADTDLLGATQSSLQVIYHANGQTYHPLPNRGTFETQGERCRSTYGVDAMRQLFILQEWLY